MTKTRAPVGLAAIAVSVATLAMAPGSAIADEGSKASIMKQQLASLPLPPPDPELLLQNLGADTFQSNYGGIVSAGDGVAFTIYLTNLDPVVETAFKTLTPTLSLSFKPTTNSLASLDSMMRTLQSKWDSIIASGIQLEQFGPNEVSGKLDIGIVDLKQADVDTFNGMFGTDNVNVYNLTDKDLIRMHVQSTRTDDTAPYYAGDAIANAGGNNF